MLVPVDDMEGTERLNSLKSSSIASGFSFAFCFMQATIQKWGNSQGIRIPKAFLEALGMIENDIVELSRVDDHIVIKKVKKESNLTLEQIFKDYEGESTVEEFDWGAPVGREVW